MNIEQKSKICEAISKLKCDQAAVTELIETITGERLKVWTEADIQNGDVFDLDRWDRVVVFLDYYRMTCHFRGFGGLESTEGIFKPYSTEETLKDFVRILNTQNGRKVGKIEAKFVQFE